MEKVKMLVVDDNEGMVNVIKEYFKDSSEIEVKYEAHDGEEAIDIIEKHKDDIDMILLDIIMPKKDGVYVLEEMKNRHINKRIIVETSYDTDDMVHIVGKLGASYFMSKPYDLSDLEKRIKTLKNLSIPDANKIVDFVDSGLQMTITKMLHELGIPSHIKGYQYIREGITIIYDDPTMIGNITKYLYPRIADRYNTTTSRVERAMRHAIEVGWTRSDWKMTEDLFGQSVDFDKSKPTNSEFLVTLADKLRLDNNKVRA
ncbi:MAG: sporulation transcription factor Spo0A [Bacilli bacterium]|nr:sporulation transcription factor Spo0A [Bacilli bacterium]